jgi:hypothetical protein
MARGKLLLSGCFVLVACWSEDTFTTAQPNTPGRGGGSSAHLEEVGSLNSAAAAAGSGGSAIQQPMPDPMDAGSGGAAPEEWGTPPILFNRIALEDDELGPAVLALMGSSAVGSAGSCANCHTLGRPTLTHWLQLTKSFAGDCLADSTLPDQTQVDSMFACFERHSASPAGFVPSDFGIYAAAAHLPWFTFLFEHASVDDTTTVHEQFIARVGMPRAGERWSQGDFDLLAEWFTRGLPGLFDLVPEDSGEDCVPWLDPRLEEHVTRMQTEGWRAKNRELPLLMLGCVAGESGADCLRDRPTAAAQAYGTGWDTVPGTTIRMLWDNSVSRSAYWSRCSPDGRFIASGLAQPLTPGFSGQILDLQRAAVIPGNFAYDATFFPDNSGFMLQRGSYSEPPPGGLPTTGAAGSEDVAVTCEQSVLSGNPLELTGDEAQCSSVTGQIGLYEQLAKSLDGEDYWVVYGAFAEDDGGFHRVLQDPGAAFATESSTTLVPMVNQGDGFEPGAPTQVLTPLQGDPMLSPSGRLLVTRVKGKEESIVVDGTPIVTASQSGYAVHLVSTTHAGADWSASVDEVGRLCVSGSKPVLSYDERWMVLHHYVTSADAEELGLTGADDPAFSPYAELGASNIYLVDLSNGVSRRITSVHPGQYALFPHFRSDGWIYFVVRTLEGNEYFAASDAALIVERPSGAP